MKSVFTPVSSPVITTLLASGTAILLSACGGADVASGTAGTAASVTSATSTIAGPGDVAQHTTQNTAQGSQLLARTRRAPAATAATTPAAASTDHLYVATNGSDANPGTQDAPFATITRAAAAATPGTTVHVAPGTYAGNVTTGASGSAGRRIIFLSDTKWGARIVGSGSGAMWTNNGSYVDITGFDVSGPGRLGIVNNGSYTLVSNNHVHDLTISSGCSGSGGAGIVNANYSASNGDIISNVVHDIGTPGGCKGVQGIYSSNNGGQILINDVYRVSAYGIHLWHAASNVTIAGNHVFANGANGVGGGILLGTGDSPGGVLLENTRVTDNTVHDNPGGGIVQYCYVGLSCIGSGNVIANNVLYNNG